MKKLLQIIVVALAIWAMAGCATSTSGNNFNDANLTQLQPGVTTLDDAVKLLGTPPNSSQIGQSGAIGYNWVFVEAKANGFTSKSSVSTKSAMLIFGTDGKFLRILRLSNIVLSEADQARLMSGTSTSR